LAEAALHRTGVSDRDDYTLAAKLRQPDAFDLDLRDAVDAVTPKVRADLPFRHVDPDIEAPDQPLSAFYELTLGRRTTDENHDELLAALIERTQDVRRISELANDALRNCVSTAQDLDLLAPYDQLDYGLPSVAAHEQNDLHGGVLPLVSLLASLLPSLTAMDRTLAQTMARGWATLPSRVGSRMWLHALADPNLFDINDAVAGVLALPEDDFWAHHRELPVLLTARFADASQVQRQAVLDRIREEGPRQLSNYEIHPNETDWRPPARAHAIWLRLLSLREAGALTPEGESQLQALRDEHPFLGETLEDHDFFSSYMGPIRSIAADSSDLEAAEPGDRLDLAHDMIESREPEGRRGWSAFCQSQPNEAFEALSRVGYRDDDVVLWRDLLNTVWHPLPDTETAKVKRADLLRRLFKFLVGLSTQQATPMLDSLVDAFRAATNLPAPLRATWWDKLWSTAESSVAIEDLESMSGRRFYERVINNPAGKLAEDLLRIADAQNKADRRVSPANWRRLRRIFRSDTAAGHIGRGASMRAMGFLVHLDPKFVERWVVPWLDGDDERAATLRSVFAQWSSPTAQSSRLLKPIILRCAQEAVGTEDNCRPIAAKILLPLVRAGLTSGAEDWGFTEADTRRALATGPDALRTAAAQSLAQWHRAKDIDPADLWRRAVKPMFRAVWPIEKRFKTSDISRHLAAMCFLVGPEFPDAVHTVSPYLTAGGRQGGGFYFLYDSAVPSQFPNETLGLLWLLLRGTADQFTTPEIAKALDAIKIAAPPIETDRRFQWLESKAMRFA
jgi:hypothetical protein